MHFPGFNHSLWNALWILGPVGLVAGVIVLVYSACKKKFHFHFDAKNNDAQNLRGEKGEFGPHSARYQDLAKLVIALSVGAVAFLINTLIGQKTPRTEFVAKLDDVTPIVVGFFGASIAILIAFMLLQTVWYEEYCHSPSHDSYKPWKYALCNVLGWTGLLAFLCGFGWLAVNLFS